MLWAVFFALFFLPLAINGRHILFIEKSLNRHEIDLCLSWRTLKMGFKDSFAVCKESLFFNQLRGG